MSNEAPVAPQHADGVALFRRIAPHLSTAHPDIPPLVVTAVIQKSYFGAIGPESLLAIAEKALSMEADHLMATAAAKYLFMQSLGQ